MARRIVGLLLGVGLAGCQGFRAEAIVASDTSGPEEARPLADAALSYDCPQVLKAQSKSFLARTDATGHVIFEEPAGGRWIHDGCTVYVDKAGFVGQKYEVARVCTAYSGDHCLRIDLPFVVLQPVPSPSR